MASKGLYHINAVDEVTQGEISNGIYLSGDPESASGLQA